jgi:hypothetical protein
MKAIKNISNVPNDSTLNSLTFINGFLYYLSSFPGLQSLHLCILIINK